MKNKDYGKFIVLLLVSLIFIFPFVLFMIFFNVSYLIIFLFPALSIAYLIISNKKGNKKNKYISISKKKGEFGFPFIMLGFVVIPLILSITIAFIEHLDFYTVIVFLSLASLFITSGFYIPISIYERYF